MTLLQERQCAPVYDALDLGKPSVSPEWSTCTARQSQLMVPCVRQLALKLCDGLLSSQPGLHLASALRSIALIRLGRKQEASTLVDTLISLQAADKNTSLLSPLCMALSSLDRAQDEVKLLDAACKANPSSIEVGARAFTAMIKAKEWQKAQQTSLRIHKLVCAKDKSNEEYFWYSMQAYSLVASDSSLPGSQLALPLAQRMIAKHLESHPIGPKSDEIMFLYATILRKMGKPQRNEALKLLNSEERGRDLCKRSMTLAMLRYELMEEFEEWQTIYEEALEALEGGERNWSRVQEAVRASVHLGSLEDISTRITALSQAQSKDRTLKLAPLYLIKEVQRAGKTVSIVQGSNLLDFFLAYFKTFSSKACAYEDLAPYVSLLSEQQVQSALQVLLEEVKLPASRSFADLDRLYVNLNACKLARLMQYKLDTTAEREVQTGQDYFAMYLCAVALGKDLPKTEMQPADDYALLAAQALVHASALQREAGEKGAPWAFLLAIVLLTTALKYSPRGYRLRVLLVQLLRQCGHVDLAHKEFNELGIKAIQQDTLGWILASRSSTMISLLRKDSPEEESFVADVIRLNTVWKEGRTQVPPMVAKSLASGIFSRVEEMVDFGRRLENSLTKWLVAVETARSTALQRNGKDITKILEECTVCLAKDAVSDQQDYHVLLNLMPMSCPSIEELSGMGGPTHPGLAFLKAMLPVAMVHQGLDLGDAMAPSSNSAELTTVEVLLSQLAIALAHDDDKRITSTISTLFKAVQETIDSHREYTLPYKILCSVSTALEAYQLLTTVDKRKDGRLQSHVKMAQALLVSTTDSMRKLQWDTSSPVLSKEWTLLLNKLPSALRSGDDGPTMMRRKAQELTDARNSAILALTQRIEYVLKEAGR